MTDKDWWCPCEDGHAADCWKDDHPLTRGTMTDKDAAPTREATEEAFALEIDKYDDALMAAESVGAFLTSPEGRPHLAALASELLLQKCTCYPGGFTPDSYEGPQEACPVHGHPYFEWVDRAEAAEAALAAERARMARVEALAEKWRYKGEFGWGAWQEGYGPDEEGYVLGRASSDIRAALADGTEPDHV